MTDNRIDLGEKNDFAAVTAILDVRGLSLVDVGCGPAVTSRELAGLGAKVLGVEPDPIQAEKNRRADPAPGLTLIEGRAEQLPLADHTADGVFFFRSLHHVPIEHMEKALGEAARVLKPKTGFLCVVEPAMTGSHFTVMKPFHDETHVRTEAQAALARTAARLFAEETRYRYAQFPRYPNFESMVARFTGQTFNNIAREKIETGEVRGFFETARTDKGDYVFTQPMLLNLYRAPRG